MAFAKVVKPKAEPASGGRHASAPREAVSENRPAGGAAWDFSKIPLYPAARHPPMIQAELKVGAADDPLEREASGTADRVVSQSPRPQATAAAPLVRREAQPPAAADRLDGFPGGTGQTLPPVLRRDMEDRFGYDFSQVRVHTGTAAAQSARGLGANAYAAGADIVFDAGHYAPDTARGRRLLAHELTHVVQQSAAARKPAASPASVQVAGRSDVRIARQTGPQVPPVLDFLSPAQITKLRAFGDADYQQSLETLAGHLRKTRGFTARGDTQKYVDIRQAAGELRTFLDYVNDPDVTAVKVVPGATGGRSPDMYVRRANGEGQRVEISNVTLASPEYRPDATTTAGGRVAPKISKDAPAGAPDKPVVVLPVNEFDQNAVKAAIRSKIRSSTRGPSQLSAQNPNTQAGGQPMAQGGDVVVQITHGRVDKTRLDQMIQEMESELLASPARRVQINSVDAAEPRAGRKIFEYSRQGQGFVGTVRAPNRPVLEAAVETPGSVKLPGAGIGGLGRAGIFKAIGGTIFSILVNLAFMYIVNRIARKLEEAQIESALKSLEPMIADRLGALAGKILERQSASEKPVFAVIRYSLNYMHAIEDPAQRQLNFGANEHDIEGNKAIHDLRREDLITFFSGATLLDVSLVDGDPPADSSTMEKPERDKYGTMETQHFTFSKAVALRRLSDAELRDYVLQQSLAEEMNAGADGQRSARATELETRLNTLQDRIAKDEARKEAERQREREAEEKRKQAKLAQARAAAQAPPAAGPPLLPQPGVQAPQSTFTAQNDPFNLGGRPQQKSLHERAGDAADIAEALKAEYVKKASALRDVGTSDPRVVAYHADVEAWIAGLRQAFAAWKAKGSPDWPAVQRLGALVDWVDQIDGRKALMR